MSIHWWWWWWWWWWGKGGEKNKIGQVTMLKYQLPPELVGSGRPDPTFAFDPNIH
jgi:hypothetical protein